ncbi:MAG TPA: hypothetical protein DCR37_01725 [Glaciecola sp.]|nr:hypothetical protein [Glaciecola sp.]
MANSPKSDVYQSPLGKLFARQQPKVKAKPSMAKLFLIYAENDNKRIAHLINKWLNETQPAPNGLIIKVKKS